LEEWRRLVARSIDLLDYEGRRLALTALGVEVKVWSTDHDPRYEIRMLPDAAPIPISDPRSANDGAPVAAHVGASIRRGCARWDGHRGDRL
jgi:hypothetical protein